MNGLVCNPSIGKVELLGTVREFAFYSEDEGDKQHLYVISLRQDVKATLGRYDSHGELTEAFEQFRNEGFYVALDNEAVELDYAKPYSYRFEADAVVEKTRNELLAFLIFDLGYEENPLLDLSETQLARLILSIPSHSFER